MLKSDESSKVQFIIEPLALPQLAAMSKFIERLSYITRTFAFYIHKEYQKILKLFKNSPLPLPAPSNDTNSNISNPVLFAVDPISQHNGDHASPQGADHANHRGPLHASHHGAR